MALGGGLRSGQVAHDADGYRKVNEIEPVTGLDVVHDLQVAVHLDAISREPGVYAALAPASAVNAA